MRRAVLDTYIDLIGEPEALHGIRQLPGQYVMFFGAGLSRESGVPLAEEVCADIRTQLEATAGPDLDAWAEKVLAWSDRKRRYTACLDAYGPAEARVAYFRRLLRQARPAFAHHGLALLMTHGVVSRTAMTTNFDKLLERAFVEQAGIECQAIRTEPEAEYWVDEPDKCYVFKLHGDYDTHNILNTRPETRSVPTFFLPHAQSFLRARGLVVLGAAGNEESIIEFVKQLLASNDPRVLSAGIRWGVFVGQRRPAGMTVEQEVERLHAAIEGGAVSAEIVSLLGEAQDRFGDRRPCSFFPVWGAGSFLNRLVRTSGDLELHRASQLHLDHEMRLHAVFQAQGMEHEAIERHIERLVAAQRRLDQAGAADPVGVLATSATAPSGSPTVRVVYGDISSAQVLMDADPSVRRAVVSPEDTTVSAGGGVAMRLLHKAGPRFLLNELTKLGPIEQGDAVATSAGELPVHYIIHAAALRILPDGGYDVSEASVSSSVANALERAESLGVQALWTPLLGAGAGTLGAERSFAAVLQGVLDWSDRRSHPSRAFSLTVVIYEERMLSREAARAGFAATLPGWRVIDP